MRRFFVRMAKIQGPNRMKSTAASAAKPKKISSIRARIPGAKELCRSAILLNSPPIRYDGDE